MHSLFEKGKRVQHFGEAGNSGGAKRVSARALCYGNGCFGSAGGSVIGDVLANRLWG